MPDLLEIEVDGEAPPTGRQRDGRGPSWGMPVAVALAGILLLAVVAVVVAPMVHPAAQRQAGIPPATVPPAVAGPHSEILGAAGAALSAWGRFAGSGDVAILSGHFHEDGPQYRQLVDEAPRLAAERVDAGEYQVVVIEGTVVELSADRAQVRATVVWQRSAEPDPRMVWLIELRSGPAGGWAIWTARSAPEKAGRGEAGP